MTTPWTPDEIETDLWLDASDSDTITIGTGVSNWADKSGNNNDATQATGSLQPSYDQSTGLLFDGSDDYLVTPTLNLNSSKSSLFFVINPNTLSGDRTTLNQQTTSSTSPPASYQFYILSTGHLRDWQTGAITEIAGYTDNLISHIHGASGYVSQYRNGSLGTVAPSVSANAANAPFYIGKSQSYGALGFFSGTVKEVILINEIVTDDIRQKIEGYIAWKWGLEDNLPDEHTYKEYAPFVENGTSNEILLTAPTPTLSVTGGIVGNETSVTPTHHWTFDDVTGTSVNDSISTNPHALIIPESYTIESGKFLNGLSGGWSSSIVYVSGIVTFKAISMWVKKISFTYDCYFLSAGADAILWSETTSNDDLITCYNGSTAVQSNLSIPKDDEYHHVVLVEGSDSNHHLIYVDGVAAESEIETNLNGVVKYFGRNISATGENASLDNIQIYNRVISAGDVIELYNASSQDDVLLTMPDTEYSLGGSIFDGSDLTGGISVAYSSLQGLEFSGQMGIDLSGAVYLESGDSSVAFGISSSLDIDLDGGISFGSNVIGGETGLSLLGGLYIDQPKPFSLSGSLDIDIEGGLSLLSKTPFHFSKNIDISLSGGFDIVKSSPVSITSSTGLELTGGWDLYNTSSCALSGSCGPGLSGAVALSAVELSSLAWCQSILTYSRPTI